MSAFEQFDPFEQRISASLHEIAPARRPDYLADVLDQTARTRQRPRWSFPGRWLPVGPAAPGGAAGRAWSRPLVVVALLALLALAASALLIVGSRPSIPLPVGPARNGAIVYPTRGDIFVRDEILGGGPARPLVTGSSKEYAPYISPDGRTVAYAVRGTGTDDYLWAIDIDGSNPRLLLPDPISEGWSQLSWAPDSKHLLASGFFPGGVQRLYDVQADGSGAKELTFDGLSPYEAFWNPVDPDLFVLRAMDRTMSRAQHLLIARADGTIVRDLHLHGVSSFGPDYTLSGAVWSPDGTTIAYNSVELLPGPGLVYGFRVHVINADGTGDRALPGPADSRVNQAWPAFSPDGSQLLVQRFIFPTDGKRDGAGWLAVMPADGSAPGRDIGLPNRDTDNPDVVKDWAPDGRSILEFIAETQEAYVVDVATNAVTRLTWADDLPVWQRRAR